MTVVWWRPASAGPGDAQVREEMKKSLPPSWPPSSHDELPVADGQNAGRSLHDWAMRTGVADLRALAAVLCRPTSSAQASPWHCGCRANRCGPAAAKSPEEKAAKTAVKLYFPLVIFIFPGVFVVLVGPAAIQMMREMFRRWAGQADQWTLPLLDLRRGLADDAVRLKTGLPETPQCRDRRQSSPRRSNWKRSPAFTAARLGSALEQVRQDLQRLGIEIHLVIDAIGHVARIGHGEEVFVESHLRLHGMPRPRPNESCPSPCGRRGRCRRGWPGRKCSEARRSRPTFGSLTASVQVMR